MKRLIAALMLMASQPAFANFVDGTELMEMVNANIRWDAGKSDRDDVLKSMRLIGFIQGVIDTSAVLCHPKINTGQSVAIVTKWLKDHPEMWMADGSDLVLMAMLEAFPCPKPQAKPKPQS